MVLALAGCGAKAPSKAAAESSPVQQKATALGDLANFLAAQPVSATSPLADIQKNSAAYRDYVKKFDDTWAHFEEKQLHPVAEFRKEELDRYSAPEKMLFYPFSGPDVLYMTAMFPTHKVYIMAGQEPSGELPHPEKWDAERLDKRLNGYSKSLSSIFNRSFFVTGEMDRELRGQDAEGILPISILLLARAGYQVENYRYVQFTADGKIVDEVRTEPAPGKRFKHPGFEVTFHRDNGPQQKVYYFDTNLEAINPGFLALTASYGRYYTFIKSCSFKLHWNTTNVLRKQMLDLSDLILQDDTGPKYATLQKLGWDISLYGKYTKPDRPFTAHYQKDLATVFDKGDGIKPLKFSLGYGYGYRDSSLILAVRPEIKAQAKK